jgi:putative transcriptional regulator
MMVKNKKPTRLIRALLETAKDMQQAGILPDEAYGKITMRHPGLKDKAEVQRRKGIKSIL